MINLKAKHRHIARFDSPAMMIHGWFVSFKYHGVIHKQFIRDDLLGGRRSSLIAAIYWRDITKRSLSRLKGNREIYLIEGGKGN